MDTLWETAAAISGLKNLDGLWDYIPVSHSAVTGNPIHYFEHLIPVFHSLIQWYYIVDRLKDSRNLPYQARINTISIVIKLLVHGIML